MVRQNQQKCFTRVFCCCCCCHFLSQFVDEWNENMIPFKIVLNKLTERCALFNWNVLNFNAFECIQCTELIKWARASSLNNKHFESFHSIDGQKKIKFHEMHFEHYNQNSFKHIFYLELKKNNDKWVNSNWMVCLCVLLTFMMMPRPCVLRVILWTRCNMLESTWNGKWWHLKLRLSLDSIHFSFATHSFTHA